MSVTYASDLDIELTGACERDIDLLLLEEMTSSRHFVGKFLAAVGIATPATVLRAARSVTTSNGESDLELLVQSGLETWKVLIENKLDSGFQPRQAERYRQRAQQYLRAGKCTHAQTVLVAPADYIGDGSLASDFDCFVTYETIREWIEDDPTSASRAPYKLALIDAALDRKATGWTLVPDEAVTEFWFRYWQLATKLAPELGMQRPEDKPAGSTTIVFRPAILPRGVQLVHKLVHGRVDLQFHGRKKHAVSFERRYGSWLNEGMHITSASKSMVVRIPVPPVDLEDFSASEHAVLEALEAAQHLVRWYRTGRK